MKYPFIEFFFFYSVMYFQPASTEAQKTSQ